MLRKKHLKWTQRTGALLLAVMVVFSGLSFAAPSAMTRDTLYKKAQKTISFYKEKCQSGSASILMDWPAVGLCAFGEDLTSSSWRGVDGKDALTLRAEEAKLGRGLSTIKNTDFQRTIIGVTAAGGNPRDFGGKDLVAIVKGTMLPNGHFADSVKDRKTGKPVGNMLVNAHCFGVISLYTAGEPIPNRDKCLEWLIDSQNHDGGFTWDVKTFVNPEDAELVDSDPDMTAAGLMAMAILGLDKDSVPVKRALSFLKKNQRKNGGFASWGTDNPESCSWVIKGLTAFHIDPMGPEWTNENGSNPVTAMMSFQIPNGGFVHVKNEDEALPIYDNGMSTEQALYGMASAYFNKSVYEIQHDVYRGKVEPTLFSDVKPTDKDSKAIFDGIYSYVLKEKKKGQFCPDDNMMQVNFFDSLARMVSLHYKDIKPVKVYGKSYYGSISESHPNWDSIYALLGLDVLKENEKIDAYSSISEEKALEYVDKVMKKTYPKWNGKFAGRKSFEKDGNNRMLTRRRAAVLFDAVKKSKDIQKKGF